MADKSWKVLPKWFVGFQALDIVIFPITLYLKSFLLMTSLFHPATKEFPCDYEEFEEFPCDYPVHVFDISSNIVQKIKGLWLKLIHR